MRAVETPFLKVSAKKAGKGTEKIKFAPANGKEKYQLLDEASFMVLIFRKGQVKPVYLNNLAKRYCGLFGENLVDLKVSHKKNRLLWQGWHKRHEEALRALFGKKLPIRVIDILLEKQSRQVLRERRHSQRYFKFIYQPLSQKEGPIEEIIAFGFEVSQELLAASRTTRAMEGLREERARTSIILETISDVFITVDRKWNVTYMNKRAELTGAGISASILGKKLWSQFPSYKKTEFSTNVRDSMKRRKFSEFDYFSVSTNKWWHYRCFPTPEGLVLYASDITEKKEVEMQKDAFIAHTSHELKTPITSLKLYAGAIIHKLKKNSDKAIISYVEGIEERLNKLTHLINSLLEASRIQRGKIAFRKTKLAIDKLIQETAGNVHRITHSHKLTIKVNSLKTIEADRERIEQVFVNLINNAFAYSPKGSEVLITISADKDNVTVAIKDRGIGIAPKDKENIFKSFYQVNDPKRKKMPSGLGLGLSISKDIVEAHGGKIWVESIHGRGSTFFVSLPVKGSKSEKEIGNKA